MEFMDIIIFHDLIAATYLHSVFSEVITFLWLAPIFKSQRWQWSQCNHVIDPSHQQRIQVILCVVLWNHNISTAIHIPRCKKKNKFWKKKLAIQP